MKLRTRIVLLIVLSMLAPALAHGIPRPEGSRQVEPESLLASYELPAIGASAAFGVSTPELAKGRTYRFEIHGTWIWDKNEPGRVADAAYSSSDNWTTKAKQGRGVQIGTINLGSQTNLSITNWSPDSTYSVEYQGRGVEEIVRVVDGNYDDNAHSSANPNGLSVKIYQTSKVHWVTSASIAAGQEIVIPSTPELRINTWPYVSTMTVIPHINTPAIGVSKTTLPTLGKISLEARKDCAGQNNTRFVLVVQVLALPPVERDLAGCVPFNSQTQERTIGGDVGPFTIQEERRNCVARAGRPIGSELITTSTAEESCEQNVPPGANVFLLQSIPGRKIESCRPGVIINCNPLPPGSSVNFVISWKADRTYLYRVPFSDEQFGAFLPFNPIGRTVDNSKTQAEWFQQNLNNLSATIMMVIVGPGAEPIYESPATTVPGLGQILEAAYESRVAGQ